MTPVSESSVDEWLGSREPKSYRRTFIYFLMNWLFSLFIWIGCILSLTIGIACSGLIYIYRSPLRRRRIVYKLISFLWGQEINISNIVLRDMLVPVSHWDLTHESIKLSAIYFVLWKGFIGFLLASLPLIFLMIDSTYLSLFNVEVLAGGINIHPLLLRLGFIMYFMVCIYACEVALSFMTHVSYSAYSHVFEAPELFRRDLQSHFPESTLSNGNSLAPTTRMTTYSRVTSGRTCHAETHSPAPHPSSTVPFSKSGLVLATPPIAALAPSPVFEEDKHIAVTIPGRKVQMPTLRAASYDCLSPAAIAQYSTLSPPLVSRGVSRAIPVSLMQSLENAHFAMFGPPCVHSLPFSLHLWAFAASQREDAYDEALQFTSHRLVSRETLLARISHGTLVHITLEVPHGFDLLDESASKTLMWTGDIDHVGFTLQKNMDGATGHTLFKCTLVVGSQVSTIRTYIVLLESTHETLEDTYTEIPYQSLEIHEWIGSGAGGDAYRARYNGDEVVVKTIRASEYGTSGEAIVEAFQHEAAILNRFGYHPHIVPFLGACSDLSYPLSIVTAYMPHGSLESHFQSQRMLNLDQKELILADIASATWTIHDCGFVHRDLAARNCLVAKSGRGILADFGMCRRLDSVIGASLHHGSGPLKYMAPETLQPPHGFTAKSDSYAFGILMWETLFEEKPFADLTPLQAAVRVLEGDRLPFGTELDEKHRQILTACFQENPMDRPSMKDIYTSLHTPAIHIHPNQSDGEEKREGVHLIRRTQREPSL